MDLFDLFWNWSQQNSISKLQSEVAHLKTTAAAPAHDSHAATLEELRLQNGELRLYVATLFRVLVMKGLVTREELEKLVEETDASDGQRDNAYTGGDLP